MSLFASFTASVQNVLPHKTASVDELTAPLPVFDGESVAFELSGETADLLVRQTRTRSADGQAYLENSWGSHDPVDRTLLDVNTILEAYMRPRVAGAGSCARVREYLDPILDDLKLLCVRNLVRASDAAATAIPASYLGASKSVAPL